MTSNKEERNIDIVVAIPCVEMIDFVTLKHGDIFTFAGDGIQHGDNVPVYMKIREISDVDDLGRKSLINAVGLFTGTPMEFKPESKVFKMKGVIELEYE